MISVKKELAIRFLLVSSGFTKACIAREMDVSVDTVRKIFRAPALRERKVIRASSGFQRIPKIPFPRKCSTCGAYVDIWPCLICHPSGGMPSSFLPIQKPRIIKVNDIPEESITELIHISQDVLNLNEIKSKYPDSPLFRALTDRASKILRKINVKKGEFVDVKFN